LSHRQIHRVACLGWTRGWTTPRRAPWPSSSLPRRSSTEDVSVRLCAERRCQRLPSLAAIESRRHGRRVPGGTGRERPAALPSYSDTVR
jgi:hypothetical protein